MKSGHKSNSTIYVQNSLSSSEKSQFRRNRNIPFGNYGGNVYLQSQKLHTKKIVLLIFATILAAFIAPKVFAIIFPPPAEITIKAADVEMYVNEERPELTAEITTKNRESDILDKETAYTLRNFIDDLRSKPGYTLNCDGDGSSVGEFPISHQITEEITDMIDNKFKGKVNIKTEQGIFKVKEIDEPHKQELAEKAKAAYEQPMLALTFDDGPGPYTEDLLNSLEQGGTHATFFTVGKNVGNNPNAIKRMKEIGCELGNHSYDHTKLTKLSVAEMKSEIDQTNDAIRQITGEPASVLRVPYGATNDTLKQVCGMPMIQWSLDTLDWKTRNANSIVETVLTTAEDGDIILMHDIHEESVEAAKQLITSLQERGFKFVSVSEMAKARGHNLENGETYFSFHQGE